MQPWVYLRCQREVFGVHRHPFQVDVSRHTIVKTLQMHERNDLAPLARAIRADTSEEMLEAVRW